MFAPIDAIEEIETEEPVEKDEPVRQGLMARG